MHYDMHDPSGTPLLLLHRGLFDIRYARFQAGKLCA
jgi:hypothetical protein